ncbi:MAG TPA: outer membrane lipoprotein-sorting protein [Myxococcota bacterium]|nr:outer membrane lipoprotein-sorting protein [Myxococcota bacterium]
MAKRWVGALGIVSFVWLFLAPQPAAAEASDPIAAVRDCLKRNVPKKSSSQTVHFTSYDRIGGSREFRGRIMGKTMGDGTRRAKLCISQPNEMRGSEVLSIEVKGEPPQNFLYTSEFRKAKRVSGDGAGGSLFGTDFTYEDLQRFMQLNRPESSERLPDGELDGRAVFIVQNKPSDPTASSYSKVLSYIDKETCVVLKSESYESDRLRKVLSAKPEGMYFENGVHAPTEVEMKDVRDQTRTLVAIEDFDVDGTLDDRSFEVSELGRHCR